MEMTIDKAISWLISIAEHEGEDIPIYDTDIEAIKVAIETMRKHQKIEQIYREWFSDTGRTSADAYVRIGGVLKDGNDNN